MTPLERRIRDRIRDRGPMPVSDYMALALADPEHGYYRKADPLGRQGDFITAPEISQAFGEIIGLWCAVTWRQAGGPSPVHLVELGPGRGTLMADALRAAGGVAAFIDAARLHLVETSPALRGLQRDALRGHRATWHEAIDTVPDGPCLFIANEFFDALPIDQYVRTATGWALRRVGVDPVTGGLAFVADRTADCPEGALPSAAHAAPDGAIFERCPAGLDTAAAIGARLAGGGIAALIIDYGHRHPGRGETLQAVRGHRRHDVLADPGDADITAHVDFHALSAAARNAGAVSFGPVSQGDFLSALGIEARTEKLAAGAGVAEATLLRRGCRRLIDPLAMGSLFKVLALTDGRPGVPAGFEGIAANTV